MFYSGPGSHSGGLITGQSEIQQFLLKRSSEASFEITLLADFGRRNFCTPNFVVWMLDRYEPKQEFIRFLYDNGEELNWNDQSTFDYPEIRCRLTDLVSV